MFQGVRHVGVLDFLRDFSREVSSLDLIPRLLLIWQRAMNSFTYCYLPRFSNVGAVSAVDGWTFSSEDTIFTG